MIVQRENLLRYIVSGRDSTRARFSQHSQKFHVHENVHIVIEGKKYSELVGNTSRGEDLHSSHVNVREILCTIIPYARWTQDTSAMAVPWG